MLGAAEAVVLVFAIALTIALLVFALRGWDHRH
jgi:hypothetical protein